jgi:alpha-glucosidase
MLPEYIRSIHHDGSGRYVCSPGGANLHLGDEIRLRLRAAPHAPVRRVLLRACPDGEQQFIEMQPEPPGEGAACHWWQATLKVTMPLVGYRFLLFTDDGVWWFNGRGAQRHTPTDADDFRLLADYAAPGWVRDSVFYQIFPDRFCDGDPANNVHTGEFEYRGRQAVARPWGEPPAQGWASLVEFYGGDLAGIEAHLDYLQNLGVNAIFLNPIFTAYSNHRYDVTDYDNVDSHLGGNPALESLRQATQAQGMRYILDVVPNHCGILHPWFQAALADPQVPTAEYFTFHAHPDDYESWLGVRSLPKLNYRSVALRQAMYGGPQAVFRRWLRPPFSADGWRIDVANMLARQGANQLGQEVGRGIRQAVKEENPAAYLLGENFFDASAQLQGDFLDASMNYAGFSTPLWHWLSQFAVAQHGEPGRVVSESPWPTQALLDTWQAYRAAIPWRMACQQFNLLGSHDTQRILELVGGDPALGRLAAAVLMTYPGVPCVYYGDEVGLTSAGGIGPRGCMPWEQTRWDEDLRAFYQKLIHLRRTSPALIDGGFQALLAEEDTLAYLRDTDDEQIIVVAQRGGAPRPSTPLPVWQGAVADGAVFSELFSEQRSVVTGGCLPLPAMPPGVSIWRSG